MKPDVRRAQVLAFVRRYRTDQGYLPTADEVAVACALRSRNSARFVLHQLEAHGDVEVDGRRPRLGRVAADPTRDDLIGPERELALCLFAVAESRADLHAHRFALDWAPDLASVELLHREALRRVAVLRAFEDAAKRLRAAGATLPSDAADALARKDGYLWLRRRRLVDWETYCAASLAVNLLSASWLDETGWSRFPYAGPALVAAGDHSSRPDVVSPRRAVLSRRIREGDGELLDVALDTASEMLAPVAPLLGAGGGITTTALL